MKQTTESPLASERSDPSIHLAGLLFVFLSILASCVSLQLVHHHRPGTSKRLDRFLAVVLPGAFAVVVVSLSVAAFHH